MTVDLLRQRDALSVALERAPVGTAETQLEIPSAANLREHWAKRNSRTTAHRRAGWILARRILGAEVAVAFPVVVLLERLAMRSLDSDNLARAFKSVRDGVADALGVDDGVESVVWLYSQTKHKPASVRLSIFEGPQPLASPGADVPSPLGAGAGTFPRRRS